MLIPIGILAVGSIFAGFPFKELFAGHAVEEFFREFAEDEPAHHRGHASHPRNHRVPADGNDG